MRPIFSGVIDRWAQGHLRNLLRTDTPTPLEGCDSPIGYQ
jgi:hypothetical protein